MSEPEKIDEVDHLRKQIADCEVERAKAVLTACTANQRLVLNAIIAKYGLAEGDGYDSNTLEIKRAKASTP
jgi:hypothetical protein